jgi:hypothetical protein
MLAGKSAENKRTSLLHKKVDKYGLALEKCENLMLEEKIVEAIKVLNDVLESSKELLDLNPFKAIGNLHNWKHMYPKGPIEWFAAARENNEIESNPFDLLCLCFITQLERKKMTLEEVIKEY